MKTINLTEEHKSKLLEMCKTLFPEYKYWNLHDGVCDLCSENTLDYNLEGKPEWNSYFRTHWFEFSWIILDKISEKLSPMKIKGLITHYGLVCFNRFDSIHPVDYLYDKFIQIKKDETTKSH
jgi:hypothetical protein